MVSAKHYIVRGRVQGVGYRYFALEAAERRQIRGYARNLPGGEVEIHAEGQEEAMQLFKEDLRRGPRMAHVTDVIETDSQVSNKLLGRELRYGLYLPPSYNASPAKKYPVVYFLHGLNENEMRWSSRGQTEVMLDRMIAEGKIGEFIVAIPFGATSFYTNTRDGSEKWEDMILTEFIPAVEGAYRVNASRATRGISGISMGGYGALKIAMKHPDLFGSVSAHSPVLIENLATVQVVPGRPGRIQMFLGLFDKIYGISKDMAYWEANNPMTLAKDRQAWNGLKVYFDCGTEDEYGFQVGTKQLDDLLTKASYPHEAHLYPGNHGWDYAIEHTGDSLLFHWKAFSGK